MVGFEQFVVQHSPRLQVIAALVTGSPEQGHDLTQDVLLRLYPRWDQIGLLEDPFGYARRCLLNAATSWWRRARREVLRSDNREDHEFAARDDASSQVLNQTVVHRALATLTPSERACVVLRYYEDLTEHATAAELGMPVGTVKSTTRRALGKLRHDPDIGSLLPNATLEGHLR